MNPELSIIIVNYKNQELILQCVQSIVNNEENLDYEIIVVDNNSKDDTEAVLKSIFPSLRWFQMGYNSGFGRANNRGIKEARGEYILLLNSDTIVIENSLIRMLNEIKQDKNVGLLGCKLLNKDGSLQISSSTEFVGLKKVIQANPIYIFLTRSKNLKQTKKNLIESLHTKRHESKWLCGAFMLAPSQLLKDVQFDEDFFMYGEDALLCKKILKKGYKIIYNPVSEIYHLSGASYSGDTSKYGQITISEWLLILKLYSKLYLVVFVLLQLLNIVLDQSLYLKRKLLSSLNELDNSSYSQRKFQFNLIRMYFSTIFFSYGKKQNSNESFLKINLPE